MAATQIPLTFRLAPLPTGFVGTPQQLATAIVARLSAVSANAISFFASGSVAPTSNVGPWLKNDQTWYVWSDALATYVPEFIAPEALGYTFAQAAPDQNQFKIWFKLDGSNNPNGIFIYANGSWQDVYAQQIAALPTTAQMNAAIAAAVGTQTRYPFSAIKTASQVITANAPPALLLFGTTEYNVSSAFDPATSMFTAPVAGIYSFRVSALFGSSSGTPTNINIGLGLALNGAGTIGLRATEGESNTSTRTIELVRDVVLAAGQTVSATLAIETTGASTWTVDTNSAANFFQGSLIQAI